MVASDLVMWFFVSISDRPLPRNHPGIDPSVVSDHGMQPLALHYVTMTNYDEGFRNVQVLYDKPNLVNTIGEVISVQGKSQLRMAETEKYPHVTFSSAVEGRRLLKVSNGPWLQVPKWHVRFAARDVCTRVGRQSRGCVDFLAAGLSLSQLCQS